MGTSQEDSRRADPASCPGGRWSDARFTSSVSPVVLVFAVVAATVLAGAIAVYHGTREGLRRETLAELLTVADLKTEQIDRWRRERLAEGLSIGHASYFGRAFATWIARGGPDDAEKGLLAARVRSIRDGYGYRKVWLTDPSGTVRLIVGDAEELSSTARSAIDQARSDLRPHLTDLHRDNPEGEFQIDLVVPLVDVTEGRQALGFYVCEWDPGTYLFPLIQRWPGTSRTAETLLVRREEGQILFLNELRHRKGTALVLKAPARADLPAAQALLGRGAGEGVDYRGVPVLGAWRPIPGTGWGIVAKQDAAEVFAPVRLWGLVAAGTLTLLAAVSSVAVGLWVRQQRLGHQLRERTAELERAAHERALRVSEESLRATFELAAVGIAHVGVDGRFLRVNPKLCQILGRSEEELLQKTFGDVTHPDDIGANTEGYRTLLTGAAAVYSTEKRYLRPDGAVVWANLEVAPVRGENGATRWFISVVEDLSEIRLSRAAARESEERLRQFAEHTDDVVWINGFDPERKIYLSPSVERVWGVPAERFLAEPRGWMESVAPEHRQKVCEAYDAAVEGRAASYEAEYPITQPGGATRWILDSGKPVRDAAGRLLSVVGLARDITTRKLAEEKAALMSRLYEALSATNKAVVHSATPGELFQRVCDAAVLGGDFAIAWIAEVEQPGKRIRYATVAGRSREMAGEVSLSLDPADLHSKGPAVEALLTGETVIENDLVRRFDSHPGLSPLSEIPRRYGVASVAAVPLRRGGSVVACLTVFSAEKGTFDTRLVELLEEMGRDVSFALDGFDREESRRRIETALRASEERWRTIVQNEPECVKVLDREGRLLEMNPAGLSMIQATFEQVVGMRTTGLVVEKDRPAFDEMVAAVFRGETRHLVFDMIGLQGRRLTLETTSGPLWDATGEPPIVSAALGITRDVTERKRDEERLRRAATVFSSSREGFVVTNDEGDIEEINEAFTAITGYARAEAIGRNMRILHSGRQGPAFYQAMWTELRRSGQWQGEIWNRRKDDTVFPAWLSISVVKGERSSVAGYVGVFSDISILTTTKERLEHLARYDPLTELPNRHLLESYLGLAVSRSLRSGRVGAVLFLDLDRFKNVNDSLGHTAGDEVLRATARRLRDRLREGDLIARLGGDEFVVLLEDVDGPQAAAAVASELIDRFRQPFVLGGGREVYVGLSVGISLFPADGDRTELLIQNADAALYAAKSQGRSTFRFYSEALTAAANERLALEADLRRGLALDEFFLHYQPIVRLTDDRVEGVEALVRWQSPGRGLVMPSRFIGATEDTGLIVPLGDRVLQWSCRQMKSWRDAGLTMGKVSVNVSPRQLVQHDLELRVAAILAETGLDARHLELEITESAIMEQGADAEIRLAALKSLGLSLAIDDFGTGYSSLSHLRRFPIDTFKIDKSFIASVPDDRTQREIVLTIISLARQLGLHVVAEGVERQRQVDFLRENGCDSAQGFFYGAPAPAGRIDEIAGRG